MAEYVKKLKKKRKKVGDQAIVENEVVEEQEEEKPEPEGPRGPGKKKKKKKRKRLRGIINKQYGEQWNPGQGGQSGQGGGGQSN